MTHVKKVKKTLNQLVTNIPKTRSNLEEMESKLFYFI